MIEDGPGVGIEAGEFFGRLPLIAAVGALLVIGEHGAGRFEFVIDLGDGDDVSMTREHGRGAADGAGYLEDFGIEDDSGILAWGCRPDDVGAHGAVGGGKLHLFIADYDHGWLAPSAVLLLRGGDYSLNRQRRSRSGFGKGSIQNTALMIQDNDPKPSCGEDFCPFPLKITR